jgi:hypothetical protein
VTGRCVRMPDRRNNLQMCPKVARPKKQKQMTDRTITCFPSTASDPCSVAANPSRTPLRLPNHEIRGRKPLPGTHNGYRRDVDPRSAGTGSTKESHIPGNNGRLAHVESRERGHHCSVISTSIIPVSAASGCKALPTTAPTSRLRSVPFMA